jgi:tRNA (guanine-N(7)-)-methyltransferase
MENRPPLPTTGRLSSRMSAAEKAQIAEDLKGFTVPAKLPDDVELEIGFGNGSALVERAKAAPQRFFIGSEVYLNGMAQALRGAKECKNIALTTTDARELLDSLSAASLTRIVVPHPDPWPKKSHHKRRIVQPAFLAACARVLKQGGELWVVTDWPDYAFHSLALLYGDKDFTLQQTGEEAVRCKVKPEGAGEMALGPQILAQKPTWWVVTAYQNKAIELGRAPWFICATRR